MTIPTPSAPTRIAAVLLCALFVSHTFADRAANRFTTSVVNIPSIIHSSDEAFVPCAEDCEPSWTENLFCLPGLSGTVFASASWDDGTGEALYVAGQFTVAGCSSSLSTNIAKWNGTSWSMLTGSNGAGLNGQVNALEIFDDGSGPALYAGGKFSIADGITVNRIAKWDGSDWSALSGPNGTGIGPSGTDASEVVALTVFNDSYGPALYVGGIFSSAGGDPITSLAKWDGVQWLPVLGSSGGSVAGAVRSLAVFNDGSPEGSALYAGGSFMTADGTTVNRIAKWNGTDWSPLNGPNATGMNNTVLALAAYNSPDTPRLYAGGIFSTAGGITVNNIAVWDGNNWASMSGPGSAGTNNTVRVLRVIENEFGTEHALVAAGDFVTASGLTVNRIAQWNGTSWSNLGTGTDDRIYTISLFDEGGETALFAGGEFRIAGNNPAPRIARWDGIEWSAVAPDQSNGIVDFSVRALALYQAAGETEPSLYAAGRFKGAGKKIVNHIARWDGTNWQPLTGAFGTGVGDEGLPSTIPVQAMAVYDDGSGAGPALYVAGSFATAGGMTANNVARWDGSEWSTLSGPSGIGTNTQILTLKVFDDGSGNGNALYAGGFFVNAGGIQARYIAKWDGNAWSPLNGPTSNGMDSLVYALEVFDDGLGGGKALYAGGDFMNAGGVFVNRIAKWNGSVWAQVGSTSPNGMNQSVQALTVFNDGSGTGPALYAGGAFTTAGGVTVNRIAKLTGTSWSPLNGPSGFGTSSTVFEMSVFNDGTGTKSALYVCGGFTTAGGITARNIAKWDGENWYPLQGVSQVGLDNTAHAIIGIRNAVGIQDALCVGGGFFTAGGASSSGIAIWQSCPFMLIPCTGDLNSDGFVDLGDFNILALNFGAGPGATLAQGDLNGDGFVNLADFNILAVNFGNDCNN